MGVEAMLIAECSSGRMRLLVSRMSDRSVGVESVVEIQIPDGFDASQGDAVGRWLKGELASRGIRTKKMWALLDRTDGVVKALHFPQMDDPEVDLPGMVRLQMARQLTIPLDEAVVDYSVAMPGDDGGCTVLAGAVPASRIQWWRQVGKLSGHSLQGVGIPGVALAALAADHELGTENATLVVYMGCGQLDIIVCRHRRVLFARSVPMAAAVEADAPEHLVKKVLTEIRRSWTSYRLSHGSVEVGSVLVLSRDPLAGSIAESCAEAMSIPGMAISHPRALKFSELDDGEDGVESAEASGSIALLLGGVPLTLHDADAVLNFASPRRAPDRGQRIRQLAMLGVLMLILTLGSILTHGLRDVRQLRAEAAELRDFAREADANALAATLDLARAEHIRAWYGGSVDWLAHFERVIGSFPGVEVALFDRISGSADVRIEYGRAGARRPFDADRLGRQTVVQIDLSGRSRDRQTAEAIRGAYVSEALYRTAPVGDDGRGTNDERFPVAFGLRLTSSIEQPAVADEDADGGAGS